MKNEKGHGQDPKPLSLSGLARAHGISRSGLENRLRSGLPLDEALTVPKQSRDYSPDSLFNTARANGVNPSTAWRRMQAGATIKQATTNTTHCEGCRRDYNEYMYGDHDHETHQFRGFLCKRCNHVLGLVCDDPEWLRDLAAYLEKTR